jgi:hypothetical protein
VGEDQSDSNLVVERIGKRLPRISPADVTKVIEGLVEILGE